MLPRKGVYCLEWGLLPRKGVYCQESVRAKYSSDIVSSTAAWYVEAVFGEHSV